MNRDTRQSFASKLEALIESRPNDIKVNTWKKQLEATNRNSAQGKKSRPKNQQRVKQKRQSKRNKVPVMQPNSTQIRYPVNALRSAPGKRVASELRSRVKNLAPKPDTVENALEMNIAKTLSVILEPDSGPVRYPDSISDPTATYKSIMEFPIHADTTQNNGRFTVIVQPILGSTHAPAYYKVGYVDCSQTNPDLGNPDSYITYQASNDLRIDPNLSILLGGNAVDVSYILTSPSTTTLSANNAFDLESAAGINYDGFGVYSPTSYAGLNFAPTHTLIKIPVGQYAFSCISACNTAGAQWNTVNNYQKIANISTNNYSSLHLNALWLADDATGMPTASDVIDSFTLGWTGSPSSAGTPQGPTILNGSVFSIDSNGQMVGSVTGNTATVGSDLGPIFNFNINLNIPQKEGYSVVFGILSQFPVMQNAYAQGYIHNFRFTKTQLLGLSPSYNGSGLIQRIRPTAMKAHLKFTASPLTLGGNIASSILPGTYQKKVFSSDGFANTSYEAISQINRVNKKYEGELTKGTYVFWAPEQMLDYQMYTYGNTLTYQYPFVVITGNLSSTAGATSQVFGRVRIVTCFEYFTTSNVVETRSELGADNYMQGVLAALSTQSLCHENPTHKNFFKSMLESAGKVVSTITKITPQISSVIETIGAAII